MGHYSINKSKYMKGIGLRITTFLQYLLTIFIDDKLSIQFNVILYFIINFFIFTAFTKEFSLRKSSELRSIASLNALRCSGGSIPSFPWFSCEKSLLNPRDYHNAWTPQSLACSGSSNTANPLATDGTLKASRAFSLTLNRDL